FDATTGPLEKHLGQLTIALKTLIETSEKEMGKSAGETPPPLAKPKAEGSEKLIDQEPGATIAGHPSPPVKIAEISDGSVAASWEAEAPIGGDNSISRRKRIPLWVWLVCAATLLLCSIPFILKKPSSSVVKGPRLGDLTIETEPPGAAVTLDKGLPTSAPHTFRNVTFGNHKITASLDGYNPKEQDLIVDRSTATDIFLQLDQTKPRPTPTPDSVKALINEVKGYETAQDWLKYHRASLSLFQRLTTSGE